MSAATATGCAGRATQASSPIGGERYRSDSNLPAGWPHEGPIHTAGTARHERDGRLGRRIEAFGMEGLGLRGDGDAALAEFAHRPGGAEQGGECRAGAGT